MRISVIHYFIPYPYSMSQFANAHLLLVAFAVITILTKNVSSEISNHIEHIPAKEGKSTVDSDQKHVDKSSAIAPNSKSNDTETSRRARYWRMAPAMIPVPPEAYRFERRSSAAAAAAAAAAADEDLRNFGRILKYHAVPYDGRKHIPSMPPRRPYGSKMRYKYLKQDPFVSQKYKWHQQAISGHRGYADSNIEDIDDENGGGTGDYVAFPSDDSAPYDDYYEDGQSMVIADDSGDYKKGEGDWFSKNYRNKLERERETASGALYEDTEPALSLEHSVGKRVPFAKYGGDFESYGTGMDQRYKKPKLVRGRGEPNPEFGDLWNNGGIGGKRSPASNSAMFSKYRRPQRPISTGGLSMYNSYKSTVPQSAKYSPFELDDSHRFKLDTMPKYAIGTGAVKSIVEANKDDFEKQERDSALKMHHYRRRNKLRDRGRFGSGSGASSSNSALASFNEDELASSSDDGAGNRYESGSQIPNDQENAILASLRRPSQPIQEEDVVVYSSRYRNKQAAAAAAAQRVLDTSDSGSGADRVDRPRFLVNFHDRPTAAALLSSKPRQKFASNEESRKFSGNEGIDDTFGFGFDYGYGSSPSLPSEMDDLIVNESHAPPRKFSYKLSAPYSSLFSSSSPSPVYIPPSPSSSSSHQRKINDRRSPSSPTTTTSTTSAATQKTTTTTEGTPTSSDGDSDSNSNPDVVQDFDFDSEYSNHKGNGARFKAAESDPERISASELIAYMSASPSEPVVSKQDRFTNEPAMLGYPFVRTFSEQREKLGSKFYKSSPPSATHDQDFEINLDQYTYRRRRKRRHSDP